MLDSCNIKLVVPCDRLLQRYRGECTAYRQDDKIYYENVLHHDVKTRQKKPQFVDWFISFGAQGREGQVSGSQNRCNEDSDDIGLE